MRKCARTTTRPRTPKICNCHDMHFFRDLEPASRFLETYGFCCYRVAFRPEIALHRLICLGPCAARNSMVRE